MNPLKPSMEQLGQMIAHLHSDGCENSIFQWVDCFLEIDFAAVIAYCGDQRPRVLYKRSARPQPLRNIDSDYVNGAYLLDPFYSLHVDKAPRGLYSLAEVSPDQFKRTEYYITYYRHISVIDEIVFVSYPSAGVSVHLSLGRDSASIRKFRSSEIKLAQTLAPVLCAVAEQRWSELRSVRQDAEIFLPDALRERLETEMGISLTPRQAQVAMLILRGHSSVSISLRLGISEQTVKVFRKQLYRKCGISSQAELFSMMMPLLSNIAALNA